MTTMPTMAHEICSTNSLRRRLSLANHPWRKISGRRMLKAESSSLPSTMTVATFIWYTKGSKLVVMAEMTNV